ncbi:MAG: hypothetical protein HY541_00560 [Deltaproteobacteria bacterium]|nr:hypothetical protein [Deltaproteobacteria bacterium]
MKRFATYLTLIGSLVLTLNCGESGDSGRDYRTELDDLDTQIQTLIEDRSCNADDDCYTIAYGSKACGGPQTYLVYSSLAADVESLESLVEEYNQLEDEYNAEEDVISTCDIAIEPEIACTDETCQEIE